MAVISDYIPHPWLKNSHFNTIAAAFIPRGHSVNNAQSEALLIPVDKETLLLAHAHVNERITRCLVIIHGLEGSSTSPYVLGLTAQALELGFNVVRLNLRNCGNTLHLTPTLYNAGQSNDLLQVVDWLAQRKGQSEQFIVGYSLGGNLVLKAAAELGNHYHSIAGACAISPSIDLSACVDRLETGINRIYESVFLYSLKKKILLKHKLFPERYDLKKLTSVNSIRSFDDQFTAPAAGYSGAAHYYKEASALALLDQIKIPALVITAQDDPLVPFHSFSNIKNKYIQLLAPKYGGHVSFLSAGVNYGHTMQSAFWADSQILSFCLRQSQIKESIRA